MTKIEVDGDEGGITLRWKEEAVDLEEEVARFKRCLRAAGYGEITIEKLAILSDDEVAKRKLLE